MKFWDHIQKNLLPWFLETSVLIKALLIATGKQFDALRDSAYLVLNEYYVHMTTNIENYAIERNIKRFRYETDENYKNRIIYAFDFMIKSGTKAGIIEIISMLIQKPFYLHEGFSDAWELGTSELGYDSHLGTLNHTFVIEFYEDILPEEVAYIQQVLNEYKPAHAACVIKTNVVIGG